MKRKAEPEQSVLNVKTDKRWLRIGKTVAILEMVLVQI